MPKSPVPFRSKFPIGAETIHARLQEIGRDIMEDLEEHSSDGMIRLTVVPILTGALIFAADLIRCFKNKAGVAHPSLDCHIQFMLASSWPNSQTHQDVVSLSDPGRLNRKIIEDCDVLIVDDIHDSGHTLQDVKKMLGTMKPRRILTAVLLDKVDNHPPTEQADFRVFAIPNLWVVGYGLDQDGLYRNLPFVDVLDQGSNRPQTFSPLKMR